MGIHELMFLSTCNRVEFLLNTSKEIDKEFVTKFILSVYPEIKAEETEKVISSSLIFEGEGALKHLFNVVINVFYLFFQLFKDFEIFSHLFAVNITIQVISSPYFNKKFLHF